MDTIRLIVETVHEQFLNLYDAKVLIDRGILTDIPEIQRKLSHAENSLKILQGQLEERLIPASTKIRKKQLTPYGKKHIMAIEKKAEGIADRFFESTDNSPGYYFFLSARYQAECQRLDNHRKRGRS